MAKKKGISLVVWLVVFLLLGAIYLVLQKSEKPEKIQATIFPWSQDEVVFISRSFNRTNTMEYTAFERRDSTWYMVFPVEEKAHPELLHRLLDNLGRIKSEQAFVVPHETNWSEYGFSPYLYRFVISNTRGEAFVMDIGSVSVGQNYYYVRLNQTETNYQVYTFNLVDLVQDQGAYRWPDIFDIPFDALERVVFFYEGAKAVELRTNTQGWEMVYPENRLLTNFSVKSMLLDFYPLQADHFLTTETKPLLLQRYGLSRPRYGVIFVGSGRTNSLWVSSQGKDGFLYAYSFERQGVFVVSESEVSTKWITQASQFRR
ncbi:hypothetical protein BREVNS_0853 [Brevinematales bacterium NS]|nr:DUF4340 domain-containing protein [Brevinematales bacterium]QJR21603.1 hypothetical protein BREVNS_0853 [Brevinematales bacterium NS]